MNTRLSTYLDATRALTAFVVLLSHWAYARFTDGHYLVVRELNLGSDAVIVFFVLSGFIIAYAAETKDRSIGAFVFHRATRIYSVALPAFALTQVFDAIGQRVEPAAYDGWWLSSAGPGSQAVAALAFTGELWFSHTRIGTNGPYWSLAYEVWYYAAFACLYYLRGIRRVCWAAVVFLLMGPKILLLAPSWCLGVWLHRVVAGGLVWRPRIAWTVSLVPVAVYVVCQAAGLPPLLLAATRTALGPAFVTHGLGFSDEFLWNALIGVLAALHLLGVAALVRGESRPAGPFGAAARWLAGASFSLYLVHYPTLQLLDALLPASGTPQLRHGLMLALTLAVCLAFAWIFERRLATWRGLLRDAAGSPPPVRERARV